MNPVSNTRPREPKARSVCDSRAQTTCEIGISGPWDGHTVRAVSRSPMAAFLRGAVSEVGPGLVTPFYRMECGQSSNSYMTEFVSVSGMTLHRV